MKKSESAELATAKLRASAYPCGGSLPALMNQGGSRSHASADSIPVLMGQGSSTKRALKAMAMPLRRTMGQ